VLLAVDDHHRVAVVVLLVFRPGRLRRLAVLAVLGKCRSECWLCWLIKAVASSTADGLRTVAGR
jgi:hypothetical protein